MAMSLTPTGGGATVVFDNEMIWDEEFFWSPMNCESWKPVGGGSGYEETKITDESGRPITLIARNGFGLQTRATLLLLKAQSEIVAATYTLEFPAANVGGGVVVYQYKVRYRNEIEPSPIQMRPAYDANKMDDNIWYQGTIYFEVVP